jgi:hypothetical protein
MTRSDRPRGLAVLLVSLLVTSRPAVAHASDDDDATARAFFTEGRKLAAAGDYAAACPLFARSYKLDPGIGTNFNLADCEEHLGHTASAWRRFLDVAAATKAAEQPERERVARARAAALEPRLSKLVIKVPTPAPGIIVRRDGDVVPQESWGITLPLDPGEHVVETTAPGRRKWSATVAISATPEVAAIDVPALEKETPVPNLGLKPFPAGLVSASAPDRPASDDERRIPRLTLWLGALGVASLATGAVFALLMENANSQAEGLCTLTVGTINNVCKDSRQFTQHADLLTDAQRDRTIYYVGASVGAASLIAAGSWWWRSSHAAAFHPKGEIGVAMAPMFATGGAQMGIKGTW